MISPTESLLSRYQQKLESTPRATGSEVGALRRAYRQAAAVLDCFAFKTLRPAGDATTQEDARALLFDDVVASSGRASEQLFTLRLPLRQEALREIGSREAMREALARNLDRPATLLQTLWEGYLATGVLPPLDALGYRDLANICQIVAWLDGLDPALPKAGEAQDWLRRRSVFASFEHLMAENFTGRVSELAMLRQHIGALPPKRGVEAAWNQLRSWVKLARPPILVVHGAGGIGKSALIGRLLWEHAVAEHDAQIPFAYLTFDQPSLRVEASFTILQEAATQLELQFPEYPKAFAAFKKSVLQFRDSRGALVGRKTSAPTRGARSKQSLEFDDTLHQDFGKLLQSISARTVDKVSLQVPVLLVFDTFEEVQYRDRESLAPFWRMLERVQQAYPPLRVIICGRAAVGGVDAMADSPVKLREEVLRELDLPDRVSLLVKLGVPPELAPAVGEQVGGNPLTLRLAARVVEAEPTSVTDKGIDSLVTRRLLFFQIGEHAIQGQLYQRVLAHIHDERVRRLAHPGMVLRRVDPDVILHVLAPLCLPEISSPEEATRIFDELRRENALVTVDGADGALVYRPDVRRSLLLLLEQDRFDEVRRLRRAAVDYYSTQPGVTARGEELYHRLALGEDTGSTLDSRWMQGVEMTLASGLEDYGDAMKAWLASRMSLEVPRSVFANADTAEWERNTTRKVQRALSQGEAKQALTLIGERTGRTSASPLFALEVKAHMHMLGQGAPDKALEVLERGILNVSESTNRGRLAELLWLKAQLALMGPSPDPAQADESLFRAQRAIERAAKPLPLVHIISQRLLLRRFHDGSYKATTGALQQQLAAACERLDPTLTYSAGFVAALAAQMLGKDLFPATYERLEPALAKAGDVVRAAALTAENLQGLDEYRQPWELYEATSLEAAV